MGINEFFLSCLGVRLYNPVWSWGAHNEATNRVYLRASALPTRKKVLVYDPEWRESPGHAERQRHLAAIRDGGAEGYVVVVEFDRDGEKIASFKADELLKIGGLVEENGCTFARIEGKVPIELIRAYSDVASATADIASVRSREIEETTRRALIDARLGQGTFRRDVLRLWDNRCAVTGVTTTEVIRASHILPWSQCTNKQRLDPHNGLPLTATLDALFDRGLITFNASGQIRISHRIDGTDAELIGLTRLGLSRRPPKPTAEYLKIHEKKKFQS